ncbi:reverse transcriptase domain, Reverse transcriptase zinc-binding domain protein [Artemisia annua]|uniref:Reverse transcriptase domain, Reverse transcriptase zinc-binding domain protein n=1 Tax=Artemisia annua TaxID=35608 RepID=A0A2U1KZD1_ARTAN|nr:reverse transcriptase domain, Reverse transcriptase zinc-binding domain protein [Artemisia annua]
MRTGADTYSLRELSGVDNKYLVIPTYISQRQKKRVTLVSIISKDKDISWLIHLLLGYVMKDSPQPHCPFELGLIKYKLVPAQYKLKTIKTNIEPSRTCFDQAQVLTEAQCQDSSPMALLPPRLSESRRSKVVRGLEVWTKPKFCLKPNVKIQAQWSQALCLKPRSLIITVEDLVYKESLSPHLGLEEWMAFGFCISCFSTKLRWNNLVPGKINILAWRIRNYRPPTRANLDKRGINLHSILCPFCEEKIEDEDHVFALCTFSRNIWDLIRKWWGLDVIPLDGALNVLDMADDGDLNLGERTSSFFDVVVLSAIGWIWRARNLLVFQPVKVNTMKIIDE